MVLGLVRVVDPLRQLLLRRPELVGRTDRVVVAELAVALGDDLEPLLPVDAVLEGQAQVVVVERSLVHQHRQEHVLVARGLDHDHARRPLEQVNRLQIDVGHEVDLAGLQGAGARRHVGDEERLGLVEVDVRLPVVRVLLC